MRNAEIAAALDELADLYELDGAVVYRVVAYRQAARSVRDSPRSVAQLAAGGTRDRAPARRQDARAEDPGAGRDRRHPTGGQAPREVPWRSDPLHRDPGPRTQDRTQDLRRARHQRARRAARRRRRRTRSGRFRASGRRPRRTSSRRSSRTADPSGSPRLLLSAVLRSASRSSRPCASIRPPTGSRSPAARAA